MLWGWRENQQGQKVICYTSSSGTSELASHKIILIIRPVCEYWRVKLGEKSEGNATRDLMARINCAP